jgi:type III secretory pathway component EscR
MDFIRGVLDRIILVAGVVAAGCVPSFIAQYRQRVSGQLNQVLQDLAPFQEIANRFHHGSIQELIQYHLSSANSTFHNEGTAIQTMVDSAEHLKQALQALNTDLFHQMVYLLTKADPLIARATWEIFSPSFNITPESVVFALIVGFVIWLVFIAVWTLIDRLSRILLAR